MNQDTKKLEAVICQMLATHHAERNARRKALRQPIRQSLDEVRFPSRDEMIKQYIFAALNLDVGLTNLSLATAKLPKPYDDIFCYLAFKDMLERMQMYQQLVDKLCQQDTGKMLDIAPVADAVAV